MDTMRTRIARPRGIGRGSGVKSDVTFAADASPDGIGKPSSIQLR